VMAISAGIGLFTFGSSMGVQVAGIPLALAGMITLYLCFRTIKEKTATAVTVTTDPFLEIRRGTIRDVLIHQPNENIMGVVILELERGDSPPDPDESLLVMLVKASGNSLFPYEKEDMEFFKLLYQQFPAVNLQPVPPLLMSSESDRGGSHSLDRIISLFFLPTHMQQGTIFYGTVPGSSLMRQFDVIARFPASEKVITNLINERIKVLSTGKGFGEAFGKAGQDEGGSILRSSDLVGAIVLALVTGVLSSPVVAIMTAALTLFLIKEGLTRKLKNSTRPAAPLDKLGVHGQARDLKLATAA